jgi:hypothetical protein
MELKIKNIRHDFYLISIVDRGIELDSAKVMGPQIDLKEADDILKKYTETRDMEASLAYAGIC